jgi:hypothetical protein
MNDYQISCCFRYGDLIDESVASAECNRATMGGVGAHCFLMPLIGQGAKQPSFPFSVHQVWCFRLVKCIDFPF